MVDLGRLSRFMFNVIGWMNEQKIGGSRGVDYAWGGGS